MFQPGTCVCYGEGNFNLHPDAPAVYLKAVVAAGAGLDLKKIAFEALPWDLELHCSGATCRHVPAAGGSRAHDGPGRHPNGGGAADR